MCEKSGSVIEGSAEMKQDGILSRLNGAGDAISDASRAMVIAIQRPHSRAILSGEKEIEFRRTNLRESNLPEVGLIYEPSPEQSIIGVFEIEKVERHPVDNLWELAKERTPSTKESFFNYFEGKREGTAIFIEDSHSIDERVPLKSEPDGEWAFSPPQNFYYVDPEDFLNSASTI